MLLLLSIMMRWTNPSQPTSSKLKVESKICFFEFCQFQSGIGPPPQSRLLQKMSGKKSTNRVRRLSVRENWYNWDHFQCRATREEGSGWEQAGWVTNQISNIQNLAFNWTTHSLGWHSRAGSKGWYFVRYSDTRPFLLYFIFMIFFDRSYFHLEYLFWYFIFLISNTLFISFILNTQTEDLSMSAELNTRVDFSQERWILSLPLLPSLIFLVLSLLSHPSCLCLLK